MERGKLIETYLCKRTELLLYIANDAERVAYQSFIGDNNVEVVKHSSKGIEVEFFRFGKYHIMSVSPNSIGGRAVNAILSQLVKKLPNLQYIANIGCCATTKNKVDNTVIFASKIFDADTRKENSEVTEYYIGENKHSRISNIIETNADKLKDKSYKLEVKGMISGSAVVKGLIVKKKYVNAYPTAAGIEMEGLAISDYAISNNIEWIVIKGVSDNAINKRGGKGQGRASERAFTVFKKLLVNSLLPLDRPKVFISGAISKEMEEEKNHLCNQIEDNSYKLGLKLLENGYKIIHGLGRVVGFGLVASAYSYHRSDNADSFSTFMEIFPFPRTNDDKKKDSSKTFYRQNRKTMIEQCIASIFIYGRKTKRDEYNGVFEEYSEAGSAFLPRIVLPQKDFYTETLFETIKVDGYDGIKDDCYIDMYNKLSNDCDNFNEQISLLIKILNMYDDLFYKQEIDNK